MLSTLSKRGIWTIFILKNRVCPKSSTTLFGRSAYKTMLRRSNPLRLLLLALFVMSSTIHIFIYRNGRFLDDFWTTFEQTFRQKGVGGAPQGYSRVLMAAGTLLNSYRKPCWIPAVALLAFCWLSAGNSAGPCSRSLHKLCANFARVQQVLAQNRAVPWQKSLLGPDGALLEALQGPCTKFDAICSGTAGSLHKSCCSSAAGPAEKAQSEEFYESI